MLYHAIAFDYDGSLATNGMVDEATVDALVRVRKSGRRVVLVTGRLLEPLLAAFPQVGLFDLVVAENGALLYLPESRQERLLADAPSRELVEKLRERGVPVDEVGRVIIATFVPHETAVLETIRDMSLDLQVIFNKGAVMVLPSGVNKASGLRAALAELGLSSHNTVGVGDAENDLAFLKICGASVAVANALDTVKQQVDVVLNGAASVGAIEVIDQLIADDLKSLHARPDRGILLGEDLSGEEVRIPVYGTRVLVTGDSAGGKSKLAIGCLEQLMEQGYQTVVFDPEGDYQSVAGPIALGTLERAPTVDEVLQVVRNSNHSCVVSLFAAKHDEQPEIFSKLYRALQDHRVQTGQPHWNIIDEAHYLVSPAWKPLEGLHLENFRSVMYVSAYPEQMLPSVLGAIDLFVAISEDPAKLIQKYCEVLGEEAPKFEAPIDGEQHRAIAWWRGQREPFWFRRAPSRGEHQRHQHQYFDGEMHAVDCFYFRGPQEALNLAAGNLRTFMQLADGVDEETWAHHLKRGDYAHWFRDKIQDQELAALAERLQQSTDVSPPGAREQILELIRKLYIKEI